jgi:hypothetical protein
MTTKKVQLATTVSQTVCLILPNPQSPVGDQTLSLKVPPFSPHVPTDDALSDFLF